MQHLRKRYGPVILLSSLIVFAVLFGNCALDEVSGAGAGSSREIAAQELPAAQTLPTAETQTTTVAQENDPWLRNTRITKWTGDLDDMIERSFIRMLVVHSPTLYFLDGGRERGISAEAGQALEDYLNEKLKSQGKHVDVVAIPVRRDQLIPFLVDGRGDIASGNLTITDERREKVDFADPQFKDVQELLVTGPGDTQIGGLDDLAGREIWVRKSSSYYESLQRLNQKFGLAGKPEINIEEADDNLEDEDLLEMVNAGLLPATVVDSHKLDMLWGSIFKNIVIHRNVALREKGQIATAVRKGSPQLLAALNSFYKVHGVGKLTGNVLIKRYFKDSKWVRNASATRERQKFLEVVDFFKKYGDLYDFDHLMLIAQAYQESKLDQSVRSHVGAVGIMQVLPTTASNPPISIPNIEDVEANIQAGVKYLRYIVDQYFDDPNIDPIERLLFAFASYNAGPNRIARLRRQAAERGLDPNVWFREVEWLVESKVSREPVRYVRNIFKYYIAYKRIRERELEKQASKKKS